MKDELLEYFDFSTETPSNSSFYRRRAQILPEAFEFLFREFSNIVSGEKKYRGYRLLACDGSDLNIAHNPQDKSTYFQSTPDSKGFNLMHLNALYDLMNRTYADAVIQPSCQQNEYRAMCDMIDRYAGDYKSIFIADRGYESYNVFAHVVEKGLFYLIRVKDITGRGIAYSFRSQFPDGQSSFDKTVSVTLTKKQTNAVKAEPDKYLFIANTSVFDFADLHYHQFYEMQMRIVRFPISEDAYECVITNLPPEEFSSADIRELYHLRWGIQKTHFVLVDKSAFFVGGSGGIRTHERFPVT